MISVCQTAILWIKRPRKLAGKKKKRRLTAEVRIPEFQNFDRRYDDRIDRNGHDRLVDFGSDRSGTNQLEMMAGEKVWIEKRGKESGIVAHMEPRENGV